MEFSGQELRADLTNAIDPTLGGRTSAITAWSVTAVGAALLQSVDSDAVVLVSNLSPVAG
ncbi:hypothetical protein [Rhodococcus sp. As11]|uniref:hypothetical protein n=1 Tax=Rhodococcus sp. As11 TaxID=3029189 RepID=UPI003B7A1E46